MFDKPRKRSEITWDLFLKRLNDHIESLVSFKYIGNRSDLPESLKQRKRTMNAVEDALTNYIYHKCREERHK